MVGVMASLYVSSQNTFGPLKRDVSSLDRHVRSGKLSSAFICLPFDCSNTRVALALTDLGHRSGFSWLFVDIKLL